jgi:hypothetical protein
MAGNKNLHKSRAGKTDEFYTQLSTIEDELRHYRHYFKGKTIFCNADDPAVGENGVDRYGDGLGGYTSNFFRYFQLNFEQLGIKKLITTHYDPNKPTYKLELEGDIVLKTPLKQNGDFRSPECMELLQECDIVVTNPPFSLMKEYLPTLINSGKLFLILGNKNHAILREIFAYFKNNNVWLGYNSGHFWFKVPDYYEEKQTDFKIDETGQKWRRMGNICWFTNMDIEKRHQPLMLYKNYSPDEYPFYDQYNAINVDKTTDIPEKFNGIIGVPITFLAKHCPGQFEIIGVDRYVEDNPRYGHRFSISGKETYARILIRRIQRDN